MINETSTAPRPGATSRLPLLNGHSMPRIGLGTWPMLDAECEQAVRCAVQTGYRLVDTAVQYRNEEAVGRGIRTAGVPRAELFISSKFNKESHSVDGVRRAYDESLRKLRVDYLDMFMCHWPVPALGAYAEAWKGLVTLLEEGAVKAIGVSNFKPAHLRKIIEATGVVPDVNQIQLSPALARTQPRAVHRELGIRTACEPPCGGHRRPSEQVTCPGPAAMAHSAGPGAHPAGFGPRLVEREHLCVRFHPDRRRHERSGPPGYGRNCCAGLRCCGKRSLNPGQRTRSGGASATRPTGAVVPHVKMLAK